MSDNVGLLVVPIFEFVVIIVIGLIASLIEVNIISNLYQISQLKKVGAAVGYILSFIIPAILLIPFSFVVAFIIV
jgi:pheromone shutdown protein TraB